MFATGKMWLMLSKSYKKSSYNIKKALKVFFAALLPITSIVCVKLNLFYCKVMLHVYSVQKKFKRSMILLRCDNLHLVPCLHHLAPSVKSYYYLC